MYKKYWIFNITSRLLELLVLVVCYKTEYLSIMSLIIIELIFCIFNGLISYKKTLKPISYLYKILKTSDFSNIDFDKFDKVEEFGTKEVSYIIRKFKFLIDIIEDKVNDINDMTYVSEHDELTSCYNTLRLNKVIPDYEQCKCLCVIFADVNNLKKMNDTLGHTAGDKLLRNTSKALSFWTMHNGDVYRVGGDEFMVVIPDTDYKVCKKLINKWYSTIGDLGFDKVDFECRLSYGVSFAKGHIDFEDLRKEADSYMYQMKTEIKSEEPR